MSKYKLDSWNPWTKTNTVQFKSKSNAIGDGESKLGEEFKTKPLGQNKSYDLEVNKEKWEIKKLDDDGSFRLGVSVSTKYNDLLFRVINCYMTLTKIKDQLLSQNIKNRIMKIYDEIETAHGRAKHSIIVGLFQNELAEANLNKLNELLESLKDIISFEPQIIEMYSSFDGGKNEYSSLDAVKKINIENISQDQIFELFRDPESYDENFICSQISEHLVILKNETLKEKLDEIVRSAFQGLRLVLVDQQKGYKPLSTLDSVFCYRITSGGPRCKINNDS